MSALTDDDDIRTEAEDLLSRMASRLVAEGSIDVDTLHELGGHDNEEESSEEESADNFDDELKTAIGSTTKKLSTMKRRLVKEGSIEEDSETLFGLEVQSLTLPFSSLI